MNKVYFLVLCFLAAVSLSAQNFTGKPFVIESDTATFQTLAKSEWQMIEDKNGNLSIYQVSSYPLSNSFHAVNNDVRNINYPVNTFWVRFRVRNRLQHDVKITLQQKSAYADFYVFDSANVIQHTSSGYNKPWSMRNGYKLIMAVPVEIKRDQTITIYERIVFDYRASRPRPIEVGFGFDDKIVRKNYVENDSFLFKTILGSFFIGLLFFAAVFNFFFFLVAKERVYLYYALCLLFGTINEYHTIFFHVFFRDYPWLTNSNGVFFLILVNFFAIQMERYFLHTFTYYPRWDKIFQSTIFIQLSVGLAVYFAGPHLSNNADSRLWTVWDWAQGVVLMCILITFLLYLRKRDKSARQFIVGCLPVAIVWVVNYIIINGANEAVAMQWNKYYDRVELLCISSLVIILSWILFQRYNHLRKENAERALLNERLEKEKEIERSQLIAGQKVVLEKEVAARTAELKQSLVDLKAAEKQLIQSEKMASLGELTAGIAHEIQNPLNFVNNFSEVSVELLDELKDGPLSALTDKHKTEADEMIGDLTNNLHKINHHGKRADAIVKAMLQHSNSRNGKKEFTDINDLAEKYLRVSYDNACLKDKTFNVRLETFFDANIKKIEIVAQDIGRVLLNLYSNAFYAASLPSRGGLNKTEQPTVWVTTKQISLPLRAEALQISVRDNGPGIPQGIIEKIFQPFFTTKPTGQGTGLGLSISYDIIKAHGGEIEVKSKEGEGAEFIIHLPIA